MTLHLQLTGLNTEQRRQELKQFRAFVAVNGYTNIVVHPDGCKLKATKETFIGEHPELGFDNHMNALKQ